MSDQMSGRAIAQEEERRSADHEHRIAHLESLEPLMVPGDLPFAVPAITLGLAGVEGVAETVLRTDATILAFDAVVPNIIEPDDAAATGAAAIAARRDHEHGIVAAAPTANLSVTTVNAEGAATSFSRSNHVHGIDTSAAPGAARSILASDVNGYLQLVRLGLGVAPTVQVEIFEDNASVVPQFRIEQDGAGDAAIQWDVPTTIWSAGVDNSDADKFKIARGVNVNTDTRLTITQLGEVGIETTAPAGQLHVDQSDNVGGLPVLVLDQADISEGTINFIASDRGVITGATDSLESVRVELGGVVRRIALYVDA